MKLEQIGLFDRPRYVAGSSTSQEAARSVRSGSATLRAKVLAYLRDRRDGATDDEVQRALGMNPSTQRPRRIELCEAGLVVDSGKRRPTLSGRSATVWFVPFSGQPVPHVECGCTEDAACQECAAR